MLDASLRVVDFDGSVTAQKELLARFPAQVVPARDLGSRVRLWSDPASGAALADRLKDSNRAALTFLGSGDYHHASHFLVRAVPEPLALIVFDHHPDWDVLPPRLGCGAWVRTTLKDSRIRKCLLLGPSSADLGGASILTADLGSLRGDRVEVYPYERGPTRTFLRRPPPNRSAAFAPGSFGFGMIRWTNLKGRDTAAFLAEALDRMPVRRVYVSIDKDCLTRENAATNWEEGSIPLAELLAMLGVIRERCDIAGADVVGDYSPILIDGAFKRICSRIDHPANPTGLLAAPEEARRINEATNLAIARALLS